MVAPWTTASALNDGRLELVEGYSTRKPDDFLASVREGLKCQPKELPSRFFYDRAGSDLFERITELPEYYLTRCDREILEVNSAAIIEAAGTPQSIVEFGSGSSTKTRFLLTSATEKVKLLTYVPVDISRNFLLATARDLLRDYPKLHVTAVAAEYDEAIDLLPEPEPPRLFLFLGSNVGNFTIPVAERFLGRIRASMLPEDRLLLGADLVKDREVLLLAYNDPSGVTAEFNRNLLGRINRELGGHFDPERFRHVAIFDEAESRIEMRLISTGKQEVSIDALGESFSFEDGEPIVTEWSHKYTPDSLRDLARKSGMKVELEWQDRHGWFGEFLLAPV